MLKLNFLAFTLMIQVRRHAMTDREFRHEQRIREINDRNLDRRSQMRTFM